MNNVIFHPQISVQEAAKIAHSQGYRLKYINNHLRAVPSLPRLVVMHMTRWPGVKVTPSPEAVSTLAPHQIDKA